MNGAFRYAGDLFPELARLQQHLDEVFQTGVANSIRGFARGTFPPVNVGTTADTVEIVAFAPGVDPKALQITMDQGLLTIAGERPPVSRDDKDTLHARERFAGSFRRIVSLPDDADPAKAEADFRDGVLHISVAKREASKPRRITVN